MPILQLELKKLTSKNISNKTRLILKINILSLIGMQIYHKNLILNIKGPSNHTIKKTRKC